MGVPYAEVIGDPIAHSRSPAIHKVWLAQLGLEGDCRATRVRADQLPAYFASRRADPDWRGCNVTIPHKRGVIPFLRSIDSVALAIGAVNCVTPGPDGLNGRNTDLDGIAAALGDAELEAQKVTLIGAGGAARAAIRYLLGQKVGLIAIAVRDPDKAAKFREAEARTRVEIWPLADCDGALAGARAIINASPMGMGADPMPPGLLAGLAAHAPGATLFDMVYEPLETEFLAVARANGGIPVDGLTMLIGQARPAFESFFGHPAPQGDGRLRDLLIT